MAPTPSPFLSACHPSDLREKGTGRTGSGLYIQRHQSESILVIMACQLLHSEIVSEAVAPPSRRCSKKKGFVCSTVIALTASNASILPSLGIRVCLMPVAHGRCAPFGTPVPLCTPARIWFARCTCQKRQKILPREKTRNRNLPAGCPHHPDNGGPRSSLCAPDRKDLPGLLRPALLEHRTP